jgi:hypothetical protein
MKIQFMVFWVMMLFSVVVGYQFFRWPCYLHLEDEVNGTGKGYIDIGREYKRGRDHAGH